MTRQRPFVQLLICLLVLAIGCNAGDPVDSPSSMTLYSIDGTELGETNEIQTGEEFYGHPVLGKLDVSDAKQRSKILAALKNGMDESDGSMAKCFWPRHGIETMSDGKKLAYVICFECYQIQIFENGSGRTEPITEDAQPLLDSILTEANIPLAPGK